MSNEAIKKLIKTLRERTTARGCTEAEAMEAAAKAAQLMAEHGLDDADLVMSSASAVTRTPTSSPRALIWSTIATCTNCQALVSERRASPGRDVVFFGREPGPQIALYLFEVCDNAIKHETAKFRASEFYRRRRSTKTKRKAVDDFTLGLVQRLASRVRELFRESRSSSALAQAQAYMDRLHPNTETIKQKAHKTHFDDAVNAGWRAGGQVNLAHGVDRPSGGPKLIGGR